MLGALRALRSLCIGSGGPGGHASLPSVKLHGWMCRLNTPVKVVSTVDPAQYDIFTLRILLLCILSCVPLLNIQRLLCLGPSVPLFFSPVASGC